jgi:lipoprotein-releasing system permease protein
LIWQFASRYLRAKKSTQAVNIISWVSMGAIAVGAAALIVVLSVFNGFEDLVKSLYSSFYPEVKISPVEGKTMLVPASMLDSLSRLYPVKSVSRSLEEKALLKYNDEKTIALLKGVDSNFNRVTGISGKMVRGSFDPGTVSTPRAIVGVGIEGALGIDVKRDFIPLTVYLPRADVQSFTFPEQAFYVGQLSPAGTFAIQQDFDNTYVLSDLAWMQHLMSMPSDRISAVEIALKPGADEKTAIAAIREIFPPDHYLVRDRFEQNRSLYMVMQTEKWFVYAILLFIFAIAAFNMIGSLSMLVLEKKKDITILKAMGTTSTVIRRIFLAEGILIATSGAALGTVIAVAICAGQSYFGWVKLGGGTFVVDAYPVSMHYTDFLLVWFTILVIAVAASWYPALKASRQPVDLKAD